MTTEELTVIVESAVNRAVSARLDRQWEGIKSVYSKVKKMSAEIEQLNSLLKQHNEIQTAVAQSAAGLTNRVKSALDMMQSEINRRVDPSELQAVISQVQSSIQSHQGLKNQLDATLPEKAA